MRRLILGLAVLAGCSGSEANEPALTPIAGSDSPYCHTYRAWKVHELESGEGFDQPNPAALRRFWNAYLITEETMLQQAPPVIRDEVAVKVSHIRTVLTPLLERYDFDLKRVRREGSAAEQAALFQAPPVETQKAQEAQYAYDDRDLRDRTIATCRRRRLRGQPGVHGLLRCTEGAHRRVRQGRLLAVRPGRHA